MTNIRKYIEILAEAEKRKTKTKEKSKTKIKFDEPTSKGELATRKSAPQKEIEPLSGKKGTYRGSQLSPGAELAGSETMRQFMNAVGDVDDKVDDVDINQAAGNYNYSEPNEKEPTTLPAKISKDLVDPNKKTPPKLDITWYQLRQLPGYAVKQIRAAFRPLFNSLMSSQLEDIDVATTLDGSTSNASMKQAINQLASNGTKLDDFNLEAFGIDPEVYHIDRAQVYEMGGMTYLVLLEKLGPMQNFYIYAGKTKDENKISDKAKNFNKKYIQ